MHFLTTYAEPLISAPKYKGKAWQEEPLEQSTFCILNDTTVHFRLQVFIGIF